MFCLDIDHDVRLHIYNSACVHMNPSRWIEGGGEHTRHHERPLALYGDLCDFQRMHHINVVHWVGYSTHMHASHTSINMFGTHACNGCLWTHSHSLGYGRQAYIYICGPAWTSIISTNDEKGYQGGYILLLCFELPYSRSTHSKPIIKFERMLCVVNPRSVWGFYGSKAWCHIIFAHCVFKHHTHHFHIHTWATCTEWVCLHTILPREVIGDKLAHFAGPCGRPSL